MEGKTKIKVQGHLNKNWKASFEGFDICYEGDNTILYGDIKDQAFMRGMLNKILDLNLKLISINPVDEKDNL